MQKILDELNSWRFPNLGPSSFGCIAVKRELKDEPSSTKLDELVARLPENLDFEANFHRCSGLWMDEPKLSEFETEDLFNEALQAFYSKQRYEPKPWQPLARTADKSLELIEAELTSLLGKCVTDKDDCLPNFMAILKSVCDLSTAFWLDESEYLLDVRVPPPNSKAEAYAGCFYDRTMAFFTDTVGTILWTGYPRALG